MIQVLTSHNLLDDILYLPVVFQLHWTESSVHCRSLSHIELLACVVPQSSWVPAGCVPRGARRLCHHRPPAGRLRSRDTEGSWGDSRRVGGAPHPEMDILEIRNEKLDPKRSHLYLVTRNINLASLVGRLKLIRS